MFRLLQILLQLLRTRPHKQKKGQTKEQIRLMVQLMRFQANVTFRDHEPKAVEDTRIKDSLVNLLSLIKDSNPELLQEAMNSLQATN